MPGCRATVCWVRQVAMQCHAVLPRPCACFLATDSDQVLPLEALWPSLPPARTRRFLPLRSLQICHLDSTPHADPRTCPEREIFHRGAVNFASQGCSLAIMMTNFASLVSAPQEPLNRAFVQRATGRSALRRAAPRCAMPCHPAAGAAHILCLALPAAPHGCRARTVRVLRRQVKELFTSNMSALGIPTVMVPGESAHIDFINGTDREATIVASQKTYLDWYLLTQVHT